MIRPMLLTATIFTMTFGLPSVAGAAPCRDAKGKFIKCAPAAPAAGTRCKDSKGKFAKCGTPGATPIKK